MQPKVTLVYRIFWNGGRAGWIMHQSSKLTDLISPSGFESQSHHECKLNSCSLTEIGKFNKAVFDSCLSPHYEFPMLTRGDYG